MLPPFLFNAKFVLSEYQLALTAARRCPTGSVSEPMATKTASGEYPEATATNVPQTE
jgi:hypothetical protein